MTEFGLDDTILNTLVAVIRDFDKVEKAVIYGSRANGAYKSYSDIDIAIYASQMNAIEFSRLWNALDDTPILYKLDVVHMEALQHASLKEKIEREGRTFYERIRN
jgi:predicted nucleotidyltransferase